MATKSIQTESSASTKVQAPMEKLHIRNILCPVDFSEFSRRALVYAIELARQFGAKLVVQHTAQAPSGSEAGIKPKVDDFVIEAQLHTARDEIRRTLMDASIDTAEVTVLLSEGDVPSRILETISKDRIDLVVLGTHGHRGFNRAVLGSVAEQITHRAVCPVLVICRPKRDFPYPMDGVRFQTILLATDFSAHSDRALAYALKWGVEWSGRIVLFHAVQAKAPAMQGLVDLFPEYNPYFERQVAGAWETIRHLVPDSARQGCDVDFEVRHGNPEEEILRVAEEKSADLIITGARGISGSGVPWGSVSAAVVRDGRFPVLVVRKL